MSNQHKMVKIREQGKCLTINVPAKDIKNMGEKDITLKIKVGFSCSEEP